VSYRFRIAAIIVTVTAATGCKPDAWQGFVYPNRSDLSRHQSIGPFRSLEECRAASLDRLAQLNAIYRGDFECGLNCKPSESMSGLNVCEETLR
jgi:hypothetical protein